MKKMFYIYIFTLISSFAFSSEVFVGTEYDKVMLQNIVLDSQANRWEKYASTELEFFFNELTSKKLNVVNIIPERIQRGNIFVGSAAKKAGLISDDEIAELKIDGYVVKCQGGNIAIYGEKGGGSLYGVYALLEKIGIKIYASSCIVYPSESAVYLDNFTITKNPDFELRHMHGGFFYWNRKLEEIHAARLGFSGNFPKDKFGAYPWPRWADPKIGSGMNEHSSRYMVPYYKYLKSHPEYYAHDKDGNLKKARYTHLCLSNSDVRKIAANRVIEWIEKFPESNVFMITQADLGEWCECENCLKLDPFPSKMEKGHFVHLSDRLLNFVNYIASEVGQKYPDKIFVTFAYRETIDPPLNEKPEPNVRIAIAPSPTGGAKCKCHDLNCEKNRPFLKHLDGWLEIAPNQVYAFDYAMNYVNRFSPTFTLDAFNAKLKYYKENNMKGIWYCGAQRLFIELFCYVQGKLAWDVNLDAEKLEDEFLNAYYGPAAKHMKDQLRLIRSKLNDPENPIHQGEYTEASNLIIDKEYYRKTELVFEAAKRAAHGNQIVLDRLSYEKMCALTWPDLNQNVTENEMKRYRLLQELIPVARKYDITKFVRSSTMQEWLDKNFAIQINSKESKKWYDAEAIKKIEKSSVAKLSDLIKAKQLQEAKNVKQQKTDQGLKLLLDGFKFKGAGFGPKVYGDTCTPKVAIAIYGRETMSSQFILDREPVENSRLILDALDDDKAGATEIEVIFNGKRIFKGQNTASDNDWTKIEFAVSSGILKKGLNKLEIIDHDPLVASANWFMISNAELVLKQ